MELLTEVVCSFRNICVPRSTWPLRFVALCRTFDRPGQIRVSFPIRRRYILKWSRRVGSIGNSKTLSTIKQIIIIVILHLLKRYHVPRLLVEGIKIVEHLREVARVCLN